MRVFDQARVSLTDISDRVLQLITTSKPSATASLKETTNTGIGYPLFIKALMFGDIHPSNNNWLSFLIPKKASITLVMRVLPNLLGLVKASPITL